MRSNGEKRSGLLYKSDKMPCLTAKTFGPCTLNNYNDGDIEWLKRLECNVMTCSKEVGETGTPHLQFSITFKRSYSLAALKKLHNGVHWEIQECKQDNNYCRKRDAELIIDRDERKKKRRTNGYRCMQGGCQGDLVNEGSL